MADFTVGTMGDLIGFSGFVTIRLSHASLLISPQLFEFCCTIRPQ
jgi:hypothetical protein